MFRRQSQAVVEAVSPAVDTDVPQAPQEERPAAAPVRDARWLGVRVSVHAQLLELLGPTLYDARLSSEELAGWLHDHQVRNAVPLLFAVGPADGFSDEARRASKFLLSLGKMTLAHELARVVLLEQLYRAFTILEGHPYHLGH